MTRPLVLVLAALGISGLARAQMPGFDLAAGKAQDIRPQDVVKWEPFEAVETEGGKVQAMVRMVAGEGWKIYASNLTFSGPSGFTLDSIATPPARKFMDPIANAEVDVYEGGEFIVTFAGAGRWQGATFPLSARYVGCTNVICLFPYTETVAVPFKADAADAAPAPPPSTDATADDLETRLATALKGGGLSFGALLALVFLGGLLSNLTPCVYPMIPITLRLLARQGNSALASAGAYALGIVVTYSALGMVAALSGGLFGSLMASKPLNLAFAGVMVTLGVTMLGFGDFSKLQALGSRLGGGQPSARNAFLMGTGAGLVAAPCTGPILAALLAYTAKSGAALGASAALLSTFSVGFALPYVALGGAASKLASVKVPPNLQVAVKLLFASVMFGLGLYYLRVPLYGLLDELRAVWRTAAAVGLTVGTALGAVWVVVPRLRASKVSMILPAVVLGGGLFAASQWLTAAAGDGAPLHRYTTEAEAYAVAAKTGKPVLIDMWAEWCEACKKLDASTFVDPKVVQVLTEQWVTLKLDLTEDSAATSAIQTRYGLQSLPTLVLMPPSGDLGGRELITGYVNSVQLLGHLERFRQKQAE